MSVTTAAVQQSRAGWMVRVIDYVELSKPRIGMLVLIAVAVAYRAACNGQMDLWVLVRVLLGTFLVACSASAVNQWLERRRDALMVRTANRPLPASRLSVAEAVAFAVLTALLGAGYLWIAVGGQTAALAVLTWVLYVGVYTPLKVYTPWNTVVGAAVGAMPVLIGWSAGGSTGDLRLALLYLIVFFWQFPHFMAIAWMYRKQYALAGMPMFPVVDPSGRRAAIHAVLGAVALVPISVVLAFYVPGVGGLWYGLAACALSVGQLGVALVFGWRRDDDWARRLLRASLIYLPTLLLLLLLVPWRG